VPEFVGFRFALSYRDVEALVAERGITADHFTIYRRVARFTPLLVDAARPCLHTRGADGSSTTHTSISPVST